MKRKFVVIENIEDKKTYLTDFSQCIGIYDNYNEALGAAYSTLDYCRNEEKNNNKEQYIIALPEPLEGETGVLVEGHFSENTYKTVMLIYFLDEN